MIGRSRESRIGVVLTAVGAASGAPTAEMLRCVLAYGKSPRAEVTRAVSVYSVTSCSWPADRRKTKQ